MCTACSPTLHASVGSHRMSALVGVGERSYKWGPQANKFEQVSSLGHQEGLGQDPVWVVVGPCMEGGRQTLDRGGQGPVQWVQCIMDNGHMGTAVDSQTERHTPLKTLHSCNFFNGR